MKKIVILLSIMTLTSLFYSLLPAQAENQPFNQNTNPDEYAKILVLSQVFEAMGKIGNPVVNPILLKGIKSKEFFIRAAACAALGRLKAKEAIPALTMLTQDENYLVRVMVIRALIENGETGEEKTLIGFLKDKDAQVRATAAEQLGYLGGKYLPYLMDLLPREKDYFVRMKIIEQLGNNGFQPAAESVRKYIEDSNPYVRQAACVTLGKIRDKQAIPQIAKSLKDENILVRSAAKESLGMLGERAYIKAFWQEVPNKEPGALVGLAYLGELEILPVLLKEVIASGDNLSLVRRESARALFILKPFVADSVEKALHKTRDEALSLNNLGIEYKADGKNLVLLVAESLSDKKSHLYPDAPFILKELKDPNALSYLHRALYQDNPDAVANIAYCLGELHDKGAVDDLIKTANRYGF